MSDPAIRLNVALKGRYRIERELGSPLPPVTNRARPRLIYRNWPSGPAAAADARRTPARRREG